MRIVYDRMRFVYRLLAKNPAHPEANHPTRNPTLHSELASPHEPHEPYELHEPPHPELILPSELVSSYELHEPHEL